MYKFTGGVLQAAIAAIVPAAFLCGEQSLYSENLPKDNSINYIDSVSVTSSRVPVTLSRSARIVSVLDSAAIAALPAVSVNDILKTMAGVDVRQRGDMGAQTDISVRGGTFDQVAIFLNGINICDPQTGHNAADFPVDIKDIDRIEILSGPAGVSYGSSSLLGALNIVTKKPAGTTLSARAAGGSYGFADAGVSFGTVTGRVTSSLSASYLRSDGFSRNQSGGLNTDYSTVKAFYQGSYTHPDIVLDWSAGLSSRDFGSNTFYSSKYDDQFEHTLKTFVSVSARTDGLVKFRPQVYWNHSRDRFELFRGNPDKVPFNHHRTNVFGVNLNAWVETLIGRTAFGAEVRNEDIVSTNLGEWLSSPKPVHGADTSYVKGLNRTNISFFLDHTYEIGGFSANAGVAAVKNTGNDDNFRFYPAVNVSMRFASDWKAYLSYNSSLRMPTFTELYYSVGGHQADKNLKAEKMQAVEGGLRYSRRGVNAVVSLYYNMGSDMIDWVKNEADGEDAYWKSVNYTKINAFGQEVDLRLDFRGILLREDFFLRTLELSYSHISQDKKEEPGILSRYALEYVRHKFVARAGLHIWKGLCLDASWRWLDRTGSYEVYENLAATGNVVGYKPYNILDARLHWTGSFSREKDRKYTVYVEANNLTDNVYYDYGNIPQPGIIVKAGLSVDLGF